MPPASMRCIRSSRLRRSDGGSTLSNRHWCRWSSELFREIPNEELSALFDVLLGPEIYDEKVDLLKRFDSSDPNPDFATALETLIQARLDRGARMVPFSSCKGLSVESIMPDAIGMLGSTIRLARVAKSVSPCLHMRLTRAFGLKAQASEIGERELRHIISFQCDGAMSSVMEVGDIRQRFLTFGAACIDIDGHDIQAMRDAMEEPHEGKPLIILAHTNPFHAMPILEERFPRLHYVRFKSEDERARMNVSIAKDLGIEPIDYTH